MALDTISKQEGGKLKAVASGTLPSGVPVVVNADGTVSVAGLVDASNSASSPTVFNAAETNFISSTFDSSSNKIVIVYDDNQVDGKAIVGTVSGTSISFGSEVVLNSAVTSYLGITFDSSNGKVVVAYRNSGNSGYGTAVVGTVSGTSISFGTPVVYESSDTYFSTATFDSNSNKVVIAFGPGTTIGKAIVGTVSGTSISFGSVVTFNSGEIGQPSIVFDSSNNKIVIAYRDGGDSNLGKAIVGTVSGTSISFGSAVTFNNANSRKMSACFDSNSNKIVIAYRDAGNSSYGTAIVGTVSGTSISFGSEVVFKTSYCNDNSCVFNSAVNKVVISYYDNTSGDGEVIVGTVSGTSISFTTALVYDPDHPGYIASVYDPSADRVVIPYKNNANSGYGEYVVFQTEGSSTNLTSENYIGMSGGAVTGSVSAVGTPAVSSAVQSSYFGSTFDSNSNKVVVTYWDQTNSKGMAVVGTVSGTSISFGTPVQYSSQSAFTYSQAVVFDSNSNKVVIAYVDSGGSSYGTAIVGTVSGTSISFGTAVVFESASTAYPQATFDNVNNKVIIAYEDGGDSDKGKAVVGTVSGTSISFGSTATFNAGLTAYPAIAYDTNAQKVVVAYRDRSGSDHGKAVVGTVSGTSISFGSATTFNAANTNYNIVVYDEGAQKVVVYFQSSDSNMEAVVGTVSGTSISFGTAAEFSASLSTNMSATYDANAAKTVVFYRDASNSSYGTYNVGTIDGTSISFSDPVVFEAADSRFTTGTYDSNSQKVVVSYEDVGNSQYATSTVINVGNITRAEVANGDAATVDIVGTVSTNQVGLTAGQQYYVQTDGTIGTTPADPSVLAGTAVSATKMVVKS